MTDEAGSGLDILIDWANQQDAWVRAAVGEVIAMRRDIPEAKLDQLYEQFLVEKGHTYLAEIDRTDYPEPADRCIYCRQELTHAARALVIKYREYCNNELQQRVSAARAILTAACGQLPALDVTSLEAALRRKVSPEGKLPELLTRLSAVVT